jgi:glucose/arabinose dehydrogenase
MLLVLAGGCARFPDAGAAPWSEQPQLEPGAAPQPHLPDQPSPPDGSTPHGPSTSGAAPTTPTGCTDPDPQVVATCLAPVGAIAVLPSGDSALVGERTTGRVLRVAKGQSPVVIATLPVDQSGGGGLTGLVLSPSYSEDELIYAYVSTPTDNRLIRLAPGDQPKAVITGIPHGPSGNGGGLATDGAGALVIATGDAGNPAAATDPGSLAGKVLRVDTFGAPAKDNPDPHNRIVASGLIAPAGVCAEPTGNVVWVTDRDPALDALYRVQPGRPLGTPAWTWPDQPGVTGCITAGGSVAVALERGAALFVLHTSAAGAFTGAPETVVKGTYGRLGPATLGPDGLIWIGTVNKAAGGTPVSSDDRVVRIQPPSGGSSGQD